MTTPQRLPEVHVLPAGQIAIRDGADSWWVIEPEGNDHAIYELPDDAVRLVAEKTHDDSDDGAGTATPAGHVAVEEPGVLWMAMRYALGRATYAVGEVGDAIERHADSLEPGQRQRMAAEIAAAIAGDRAGMDMDVAVWRRAVHRLVGEEPGHSLLAGGEQQ